MGAAMPAPLPNDGDAPALLLQKVTTGARLVEQPENVT